jgi:hypothetical protein
MKKELLMKLCFATVFLFSTRALVSAPPSYDRTNALDTFGHTHVFTEGSYSINSLLQELKVKPNECDVNDQYWFLSKVINFNKQRCNYNVLKKKAVEDRANFLTSKDLYQILPLVLTNHYLQDRESQEEDKFSPKKRFFCEDPALLNALFFACKVPIDKLIIDEMNDMIDKNGCILDGIYYSQPKPSLAPWTQALTSDKKQQYFEKAFVPTIDSTELLALFKKRYEKDMVFLLLCYKEARKKPTINFGSLAPMVFRFKMINKYLEEKIKKEYGISEVVGQEGALVLSKQGVDVGSLQEEITIAIAAMVSKMIGIQQ